MYFSMDVTSHGVDSLDRLLYLLFQTHFLLHTWLQNLTLPAVFSYDKLFTYTGINYETYS